MDGQDDASFLAALAASRREHTKSRREYDQAMQKVNGSRQGTSHELVDLTISDDDSVQEVHPKSKSVVSSETEMDDDDDEDLQRALAMSTESSSQNTVSREQQRHKRARDLELPTVSTEEQRVVKRLADVEEGVSSPLISESVAPPQNVRPSSNIAHTASSGLTGLDRKQMEQERLARNAKRKAQDSETPSSVQPAFKAARTDATPAAAPVTAGHRKTPQKPADRPSAKPTQPTSVPTTTPAVSSPALSPKVMKSPKVPHHSDVCLEYASNAPGINVWPTSRPVAQWPLGAVKKTHLAGFPRTGNEITIEEVIQRDDLQLTVLSSFMWDMEWLFRKLNTASTRMILTMQANDQTTRDQYTSEVKKMPNVRLCFPPIEPQVFCMHSKLMLFFHPDYLRLAVPTANLTSTDWGEDGLMENSVFLIDLPKIKTDFPPAEGHTTQFYDDLVYFLQATTLNTKIIDKLKEFNFTETRRYAFVHTIGGSNTGETWRRTGYCGLGRAVKNLGLSSNSSVNIDYVTSSMGSLNTQFLRTLYMACKGDDGLFEYNLRTGSKKDIQKVNDLQKLGKAALEHFRVYYPSDRTARDAHENPNLTAGTICFNPSYWSNDNFPRNALRDCESDRGVMMHNKLAFVSPEEPIEMGNNTECRAWAYVGSANLSESAWGRLVKDTSTKQVKMNCRNWECGVIVPIINEQNSTDKQKKPQTASDPFCAELFHDTIPVPMRVPAVPLSQTRKPFFFGV